jgi:hypothetical protein
VNAPAVLVCTGQPVRRYDNTPQGVRCTARYQLDSGRTVESARVAGWRVGEPVPDGGRPVMCPDCARPGAGDEGTAGPACLVPLPGL